MSTPPVQLPITPSPSSTYSIPAAAGGASDNEPPATGIQAPPLTEDQHREAVLISALEELGNLFKTADTEGQPPSAPGRASGHEGEKRIEEAQYAALQKEILEEYKQQLQKLNTPPTIPAAAASSNTESNKILEVCYKEFETREKQRQTLANSLNMTLKDCNRFFQDLKKVRSENLKAFLQENSENQYANYGFSYPFSTCSWINSNLERIRKQAKDLVLTDGDNLASESVFDAECISLLDGDELASCRANTTILFAKLKALKLDSYLTELRPELESLKPLVKKLCGVIEKVPENETEMVQWCQHWTAEEKVELLLLSLMAMAENGDLMPSTEIGECLPKFKHFMKQLDNNLNFIFQREISLEVLKQLAEDDPIFKNIATMADDIFKASPS